MHVNGVENDIFSFVCLGRTAFRKIKLLARPKHSNYEYF